MNKNFKYKILSFVSLLIFSTEISAKTAPSFDCAKATTEVEKLICSDDELAKLDDSDNCKIYAPLNCKQINNQVDDLTCSDTELLKLYNEIQKTYFELCKSLSNKDERIKLYKDQIEWIDKQKSADYMEFGAYNRRVFYLIEAYREKIDDLENY